MGFSSRPFSLWHLTRPNRSHNCIRKKTRCNMTASPAEKQDEKTRVMHEHSKVCKNKRSRDHLHKKTCNRASSPAEKQDEPAAEKPDERTCLKQDHLNVLEKRVIMCRPPRLSIPFEIGYYSPGTEPDHIPYHLYLLLKESFAVMKRPGWHNDNINDWIDLSAVKRKIDFFSTFFHSHLPKGWDYWDYCDYGVDDYNSLIAGYDALFAKGGPRYNMSGFTPLGDRVKDEYDLKLGVSTIDIVYLMSVIHSRKTPTPETFMKWGKHIVSFYCKLCSCFGIDYQHLESASEDDVCLMNMGMAPECFADIL